MMHAIVLNEIGGPQKLKLETIESPKPKKGEVRVKLKAAALNHRDVWITLGAYPKIQFPAGCGSDGAGIVDEIGNEVDDALLGRECVIYPALNWGNNERCGGKDFRVLGMPEQGTFAEYICVPASSILPKPNHLDWVQSAAMPLAGLTSWRATITHGEVKAGDRVLITGIGGGCATFACQWASKIGAKVFVTSGSNEKLVLSKKFGASDGVNYNNHDWPKIIKKMSGGVDLIIDSGGGDGLNQLLDTLDVGGRYVFFGATMGDSSKGLNMAKIFFKQIRIQGSTMGMESEFKNMLDFAEKNKIVPVIDKVFPFKNAVDAHLRMHKSEQLGKIVLEF